MSHGTSEYEAPPADPVEDGLLADYKHWEGLAANANENLRAAEVGVQLAKLAHDGAHKRAQDACIALRRYRDEKRA